MFNCNDCNGCCEDTATQISLTLGDIFRLSSFTGKNSLEMYKENIIGLYPFADSDGTFNLDLGLKIPCKFRTIINPSLNVKQCSSYDSRPLNCRLFPYWILATSPDHIITDMKKNHPCGVALKNSSIDNNDKEVYKKYVKYLSLIMEKEDIYTEFFISNQNIPKINESVCDTSIEDNRKLIERMIIDIEKNDFSLIFEKVDLEIEKINGYEQKEDHFISFKNMKTLSDFYKKD